MEKIFEDVQKDLENWLCEKLNINKKSSLKEIEEYAKENNYELKIPPHEKQGCVYLFRRQLYKDNKFIGEFKNDIILDTTK